MATRVLILGAAGRDFHDFNMMYRESDAHEVVGFTATQIPNIADRRYPAELAGPRYPEGIPIFDEGRLEALIEDLSVDLVVFAYSDVPHERVMHLAARSAACGAGFLLPGDEAMAQSSKPVIAVTAARTGAGKSPTSRKIRRLLVGAGYKVGVVRHPMPYGELSRQRVQRFATYADLRAANATIEEREEYELYIDDSSVVWAGADYEAILAEAQAEADVILWDGGNNDLPFFQPDLHICVLDPLRAGHELKYWPGEANLRRADVVLINKIQTATPDQINQVLESVHSVNPGAVLIRARSEIWVDNPDLIVDRRVLVVEDGPTLTHGEMSFGAGWLAAQRFEASEIIDPRPFAVGSLAATFRAYPHIEAVLPAMGYSDAQRADLKESIVAASPDAVVIGTPIDLASLLDLEIPSVRVYYEIEEMGEPTLEDIVIPLVDSAKNKQDVLDQVRLAAREQTPGGAASNVLASSDIRDHRSPASS